MKKQNMEVVAVFDGTELLRDILINLIIKKSENIENQLDHPEEIVYNSDYTSNMVESQWNGEKL